MGEAEAAADAAMQASSAYMALIFPQRPEPLYTIFREYAGAAPIPPAKCPHSNFLKGVKWSPDGACLLTASDDCWLRVYDLPQDAMDAPATAATAADSLPPHLDPATAATELATTATAARQAGLPQHLRGKASGDGTGEAAIFEFCGPQQDSFPAALHVHEGETVYDMAWYPLMVTSDPASCCFASSSRAHPVHLWDACTGALRCTYRGYNDVDEVTAAYSLAFAPGGHHLLAGYQKHMLLFDTTRPGRDSYKVATYRKRQYESLGGMVSCLAYAAEGTHLVAAGSYCGDVALYDSRTWEMLYLLKGHKGGVTQVQFTPDGQFLLTGARQDPHLLCWDVRIQAGTTGEVYRLERDTSSTNQRIQFDIEPCGRHLATGGCGGCVKVFDLQTGDAVDDIRVSLDTVNGCSFHPYLPLMAVATGQRRYPIRSVCVDSDDSDDSDDDGSGASQGEGGAGVTAQGQGQQGFVQAGSQRQGHGQAGEQGQEQLPPSSSGAGNGGRVEDSGRGGQPGPSAESLSREAAAAGQLPVAARQLPGALQAKVLYQCPVKGGGLENTLRVLRMAYEMVAVDGVEGVEGVGGDAGSWLVGDGQGAEAVVEEEAMQGEAEALGQVA